MAAPGPSRQSQLLRGVLDACLLAVMRDEPAYGYEMTRRLAARGLTVAEGSIYPLLGRLERDGLVTTFRRAGEGGPPRRYYGITPAGSARLEEWSTEWRATRAAVDAVLDPETVEARA
jgi:PadR family transcriptional regulator PadR